MIILTKIKMPLRRKYGRKGRKYKKSRKFSRRRRKGGKRSNGVLGSVLKNGIKYTTLYKTGVRVTSKTGCCNYVVLDADPSSVAFKSSVQGTNYFTGDMSFYGNKDKIEALRRINDDMIRQQNLQVPVAGPFIGRVYTGIETETSPWEVPIDTRWKVAYGHNSYELQIKSAITGANCNVVLYKCVARYDVPQISDYGNNRGNTILTSADALFGPQSTAQNAYASNITKCVQNIHYLGWRSKFDETQGVPAMNVGVEPWQAHQEGTTLYDNEFWCKMFKIVKSYKTELVPGQACKLKMKQKPKLLNPIADILKRDNICNKGQVFFVLKLEGSLGHEKFPNSVDPPLPPAQSTYMFGGANARPKLGIMPAAVDVMCFKKFNVWCKYVAKNRVKNIITYPDYYDDNSTENLPYDQFIDAAPSDYAQGPAVINQ